MGANRRNHLGVQSRRFSLCWRLVNDEIYLNLVSNYLSSKQHCNKDKQSYLRHINNITVLNTYLSTITKDFRHN